MTPQKTGSGTPRRHAGRGTSERPEAALRVPRLAAGDLASLLLTVAMAVEENRMPCADPDEAERILAFLARLAEHDAMPRRLRTGRPPRMSVAALD